MAAEFWTSRLRVYIYMIDLKKQTRDHETMGLRNIQRQTQLIEKYIINILSYRLSIWRGPFCILRVQNWSTREALEAAILWTSFWLNVSCDWMQLS